MMTQKTDRLNWWQIELLAPLMFGLLILEKAYLVLSPLGHELVQAAIVFVILGLTAFWLYVNRAAVRAASDQPGPWQSMVDPEPDGRSIVWPAQGDQNQPVAVEHPVTPTGASIYTQTRNGAWIRTWLN